MSNRYSTQFRVGRARYMEGGTIAITRYSNGEIALVINGESFEDQIVATVALKDAPRVAPRSVWLKGWSENEGVPDALVRAGMVRLTGEVFSTGFVEAQLAELLEPLRSEVTRVFPETKQE